MFYRNERDQKLSEDLMLSSHDFYGSFVLYEERGSVLELSDEREAKVRLELDREREEWDDFVSGGFFNLYFKGERGELGRAKIKAIDKVEGKVIFDSTENVLIADDKRRVSLTDGERLEIRVYAGGDAREYSETNIHKDLGRFVGDVGERELTFESTQAELLTDTVPQRVISTGVVRNDATLSLTLNNVSSLEMFTGVFGGKKSGLDENGYGETHIGSGSFNHRHSCLQAVSRNQKGELVLFEVFKIRLYPSSTGIVGGQEFKTLSLSGKVESDLLRENSQVDCFRMKKVEAV